LIKSISFVEKVKNKDFQQSRSSQTVFQTKQISRPQPQQNLYFTIHFCLEKIE